MIGGKVDFGLIREAGRKELVKLLNTIPGPKAIVWDQELAGSFGLIGDFAFLRSHEVAKMFYISSNKLPQSSISNIIFLTRPHISQMDMINQQLRMENMDIESKKDFHIWCIPRITLSCEDCLKSYGIYDAFTTIRGLPIHMYRIESDLASMELSSCFRELNLENDSSSLYSIARAIMSIQGVFGLIPNVYGKGSAAKKVFELMMGMRRELAGNEPQIAPQIDQLILIDRSVDLISALATQLTYDGLIDQFFGNNNCSVKVPSERFSPNEGEGSSNDVFSEVPENKTIQLTSSDLLYAEIRDFNFSAVGPRLSSEARNMSNQFEERRHAKTVSEMKQFVQKLPQMQAAKQSLATHTTIAELVQEEVVKGYFRTALQTEQELLKGSDTDKVNPFIEECIFQNEPVENVLHLVCLQSVVNCGLKPKVFEYYKREILQTYGFEHFITLDNLEKAGLFTVQQNKGTYATVRKTLKLTVDDVSESNPTDISYVHSGYAPLSVRLCEFLQWPGWRAITEVLNILPGHTLIETQQIPAPLRQRRNSGGSIQGSHNSDASAAIVVFIGGCTFAEVAAFRFLSQKSEQGGPDYVILTTKMINGRTLLKSISETLTLDL